MERQNYEELQLRKVKALKIVRVRGCGGVLCVCVCLFVPFVIDDGLKRIFSSRRQLALPLVAVARTIATATTTTTTTMLELVPALALALVQEPGPGPGPGPLRKPKRRPRNGVETGSPLACASPGGCASKTCLCLYRKYKSTLVQFG